MTFKVGDKVRCIEECELTVGELYEVNVVFEKYISVSHNGCRIVGQYFTGRFELVQEDKLPHELLGLQRYRVVKKDESDPLWDLFLMWINREFNVGWSGSFLFYGYDGGDLENGTYGDNNIKHFKNNPTLITLAERDRCVNKKQSQTKQLSKPIRSCEHNGSIYKEDTIDGVSIEDMKATRDNINSKLQTHRFLFNNPKK